MENKKILVTGGSGYLGQALISRLISIGITDITSVSRNEGAAIALKEKFPSISLIIGDIADPWIVKKAMQGVDEIFHLAALKHVNVAEKDVKECVDSNVVGTLNIVNESLITKPKVLVFVSSDKAAQPNGVYGCSKKIGEKLINEAETFNPETKYRIVRYGNVWMSTFSIGPKWKPKMQKGEEIILTDPEASRFFWEVGEAVDLIFESIQADNSTPVVPKMKAVKMGTVLEACMDVWGKSPVKIIGLQAGENKVETTDGIVFSDNCEQYSKEEFINKFLSNES